MSSGRFDRQHDDAGDESDQRKTETDDEQFDRASNRPPRSPPARDEGADRPEGDECDANSLDLHDDVSIATRALGQQPQQVQAHDDRVPADDDEALEGAYEPSGRIRKEHMEEDDGGQEQQPPSERAKCCGVGLGQPRESGRQACSDQQGPESTLGPPRPGDEPAADVRNDDPADEGCVDVG